jgi:Ca2+-transporting ATPase
LDAGNLVPADCRLIETANLRMQESALTGEAEAVEKHESELEGEDLPLGDRRNMAFMGTIVTYGRGIGTVTATGMQTELGHIATMIQEAEKEETVLQKKLTQLSKVLVVSALFLISVVAMVAWLVQGMALKAVFMTAVSMAVAAIPEGLPAVVTISLAVGAQRMLKRRALIRRLPAVETLGSVTVISSDKTGTLTQNRMTVAEIILPDRHIDLPSVPKVRQEQLAREVRDDPSLAFVLLGGALCNDAALKSGEGNEEPAVIGDPTEGALVQAAEWVGWSKERLEVQFPRVNERPFDSERKCMTTAHRLPDPGQDLDPGLASLGRWVSGEKGKALAFTKGSVDSLLERADHIWTNGSVQPLTEEWNRRIQEQNDEVAANGIRVLGMAMRAMSESDLQGDLPEEALVYLGMVGMLDPLRPEVPPAVRTCYQAGIRPVMITGDHPLIARSIGEELGLKSPGGFHTGKELATMERAELERAVRDVSLFARVSPEHKLRIVDAFQKNGEIVAMTGDGVNDAPALREADIGVAMGITGTDVSKEAADMVLQDDNFATIVAAVEQGRIILDNIVRFVRYILASNWAEILVMLLAPFFGMPIPLYPVQILWMNLVTDGLPALALGMEPGERNVMNRPPRSPQAPIIDRGMGGHILLIGGLMAILSLALGYAYYGTSEATVHGTMTETHYGQASLWQTMVFTVLVFSQLTLALAERSSRDSLFRIGIFSNRYMVGAVMLTFALQIAVLYVPFLRDFFRTTPLSLRELGLCMLVAVGVFAAAEVKKLLLRPRQRSG